MTGAPSFAAAEVSLSVATAAHLTQPAGDAVFLGDRLAPVAIAIARRPRRLMRENLVFAIGYNAIAACQRSSPRASAAYATARGGRPIESPPKPLTLVGPRTVLAGAVMHNER